MNPTNTALKNGILSSFGHLATMALGETRTITSLLNESHDNEPGDASDVKSSNGPETPGDASDVKSSNGPEAPGNASRVRPKNWPKAPDNTSHVRPRNWPGAPGNASDVRKSNGPEAPGKASRVRPRNWPGAPGNASNVRSRNGPGAPGNASNVRPRNWPGASGNASDDKSRTWPGAPGNASHERSRNGPEAPGNAYHLRSRNGPEAPGNAYHLRSRNGPEAPGNAYHLRSRNGPERPGNDSHERSKNGPEAPGNDSHERSKNGPEMPGNDSHERSKNGPEAPFNTFRVRSRNEPKRPGNASHGKSRNWPAAPEPSPGLSRNSNHISTRTFSFIPSEYCTKVAVGKTLSPRGINSVHRLAPIPASPLLIRHQNLELSAVDKTPHQSHDIPDSQPLENHNHGKIPQSPKDASSSSHIEDELIQKTFSLRKLGSSRLLRCPRSQTQKQSLTDTGTSRRHSTGQQHRHSVLYQNLDNPQQAPETNQPDIPQNSLLPPRDLSATKSRSESALTAINSLNQTADLRRNSFDNCIFPPESLISAHPRRDSAWTAEVLSIEIQVDYVMDPDELWGKVDKSRQDQDKDFTRNQGLPVNNMEPLVSEGGEKNYKSLRSAEVGVVLPMIAGTAGEESGRNGVDKRVDDISAIPEKVDSPSDPRQPRGSDDLNLPPREHWENRFQFLLSTIGYAVDLSNVWRFPFLCYKNGGGAFLIPYFTTLIFGAMPVFFLEMCVGQFNRCGPTAVWEKMAPMFKGIGIASCLMAYIVAFYYNVIIGWSFFYLFASFTSKLPWTSCFNNFNSENCWQIDWDTNITSVSGDNHEADGVTVVPTGGSDPRPFNRTYNVSVSVSSTMEYFERGMLELDKSSGLDDLGVVKWQLVLCTMLTFTLLYFCLWKGVKSTGKVVYVTATLPYVIMTILLVRGVLLPGAGNGIRYFITPKIDSLRRPKVWIDAAVQIFFSVGSGFGTHIAYASYNKFHNNCKRDCIITVIVNSFTSLFSGFVIFSYLGYMSLKTQKDIDKVATEGPGLVFIVYPEAIATLPGSVGWSIIFFFMLLALGLDSAFGGLESPLTGIRDELCHLMRYRYFREVLTFLVILSAFVFSIPCIMQGGMYVFTILDTFAAGTSIVFIVLCEVVAIAWFYGLPQFCADVEKMTGEKPNLYWRICWKFICPFLLTIIVVSSIISYQPLTYRTSEGIYTYPFYANVVGWVIACSSMSLVPGYICYRLLRNKGSCSQRLALAMSPQIEHEEIIQKQIVKRFQRNHWLTI